MIDNNYTPLVTVAMVTYNSEKYLRMAIESVLASSYSNFEFIISDDCSTDNTWQIINEYEDDRIIATQNKTNLREYPNRTKCITLAKGTYLIFIDGDDYIYPHGLEHFINGAKLDKNAGMVISRPGSNHMIYPVRIKPQEAFKYDYLGNSITAQGFPSTLFKTSLLKTSNFNNLYIAGDTFIKKSLAYKYPTILIHNGLSWWRKTPGQASSFLYLSIRGLTESVNMNLYFLDEYKHYLDNQEFFNAKKRLFKPIFREIIKTILYLRISDFKAIIKDTQIDWSFFLSIFYLHKSTFQLGDSINPINTLNEKIAE